MSINQPLDALPFPSITDNNVHCVFTFKTGVFIWVIGKKKLVAWVAVTLLVSVSFNSNNIGLRSETLGNGSLFLTLKLAFCMLPTVVVS